MSNAPIETVRIGSLKLNIWENINDKGEAYYTPQIVKSYRRDGGKWEESKVSLSMDELLRLPALINLIFGRAHEHLLESRNSNEDSKKEPKEEEAASPRKRAKKKSHAERVKEEREGKAPQRG